MTQPDLFEPADGPYGALPGHARGVDTSIVAAESVKPGAAYLREKCRAYVKRWGMTGCTADECALNLNESVLSIRPRFTEMRRLNWIEDTGERRKNDSGRNAIVWRVKA